MQLIRRAHQMAHGAQALRRAGCSIGFVPTMGALHEGHCSLIRAARRHTQCVIVSIFVNPLQFGPAEDYRRYPRTLTRDVRCANAAGCDIVFAPTVAQMYPRGFCTHVEVGDVSHQWEGASRPGHFHGVVTVVTKLLHLIQPDVMYLGQKDYQQALILQRFVSDLAVPLAIRVLPTIREPDGLAMSSRNAYLNARERQQAPALFHVLREARARIRAGERHPRVLQAAMHAHLRRHPLVRVEYLAIVNADTLKPLRILRGRVAVLGAVRIGSTRLIDNVLVAVS